MRLNLRWAVPWTAPSAGCAAAGFLGCIVCHLHLRSSVHPQVEMGAGATATLGPLGEALPGNMQVRCLRQSALRTALACSWSVRATQGTVSLSVLLG